MAAILSFNGRTIIDDSGTAVATAFTSGGLYGVAKVLAIRPGTPRLEAFSFAGARGVEMRVLGIEDTAETTREVVLATDGQRPTMVFHTTRANLYDWLQSVEAWRNNPANLHGTLLAAGETYTNMVWTEFAYSPPAYRALTVGGSAKTVASALFMRFTAARQVLG